MVITSRDQPKQDKVLMNTELTIILLLSFLRQ